MNINNPTTWKEISSHPTLSGSEFEPEWYDGDVDADLQRLRLAAVEILKKHPTFACELIVLDDCTMYVTVEMNGALLSSIYPAQTVDYKPCYFLDVEGNDEEIRVKSVNEVLEVLGHCK